MPKRCLAWPNLWSTLKQGQQKVYFWPKNWATQPLSRLNLRWLVRGQNIWFFKANFIHQKLISFARKGFSIKKFEQTSWYLVTFLVQFYHWNTSKQNFKKILRPLHSPKSRFDHNNAISGSIYSQLTLVVKTLPLAEVMLLLYFVTLKLRYYLHWLSWSASAVMLRTLSQLRGRSLTT